MPATYVARVTLREEGDLSRIESILNARSFSDPSVYAISSHPLFMLVSPYTDESGREVRSFELTNYLVEQGLLPEDPSKRGRVTQEMADALFELLEEKSPKVELYRVSATEVPREFSFFHILSGYEDQGPGPFIPITRTPEFREIIYTDSRTQLSDQRPVPWF
tara:strand:+ start:238 stop:726 length:489 start_codon:yes stop_codon:yes gene_type:complete